MHINFSVNNTCFEIQLFIYFGLSIWSFELSVKETTHTKKEARCEFRVIFIGCLLTLAVAVCSLKAVASRTLAVEAPRSVNTAEHTASYSCRQQALINIWKDGEQ